MRAAAIWIRADAGPLIGLGHVARQVAVAEVGRAIGAEVRFVASGYSVADDLVSLHGWQAETAVGWIDDIGSGDVVMFDGYELAPSDVASVRRAGAIAVWFDDRPLDGRQPNADLVVAPNSAAGSDQARRELLVGPRYCLVREEFRAARRARVPGTGSILVAMGGTDPLARSAQVAQYVVDAAVFEHVMLLAGAGTDLGAVPRAVEVVRSPASVAVVFDAVDAAISAAGATTWELLTMGVPTALVVLVDNQVGVASTALAHGAALRVDRLETTSVSRAVQHLGDPAVQSHLHRRALETVDGHGASRVLRMAMDLAGR